jgi:hypothetical protein
MKKNLFLLICVFLLSGCFREEQTAAVATLRVKAVLPENYTDEVDMTKIVVQIQNKEVPIIYRKYLESDGTVTFLIEPGRYSASVSSRTNDGIFNGLCSELLLTTNGVLIDRRSDMLDLLTLNLEISIPGGLIFREIYYVGSQTPLGANYTNDQYFEIYNNTEVRMYLDSLCVGLIHPANGTSSVFSWQGMDTIALFSMVWMIPGSGYDYPLLPGESVVIAQNAVDHSALSTSGFNFAKAHFGFYHPDLTGHSIAPGVPAMERIIAPSGTSFAISVSSPAPVIFRPSMGVQAWLKDRTYWERYTPGQTSGTLYWHIAKEWILDGVDCSNGPTINIKRFPLSVDAGFTYVNTGTGSGRAVRRKVEQVLPDGRVIYQDTNNSSVDFEVNVVPNPRLKP